MKYRHECKFQINAFDAAVLLQRLPAVMQPDPHAENGRYGIRSIYFDTPSDKALREKLDGVNRREKFRIRYYNGDLSFISLEKKSKTGSLTSKESLQISVEEAEKLLSGRPDTLQDSKDVLLRELCRRMTAERLRPKTIVDYTRTPFVFPAGNVRVTVDTDIRTGVFSTDFFNRRLPTAPAGDGEIILEVKWDGFLPDVIKSAVFLPSRREGAFSKYAVCRIYG